MFGRSARTAVSKSAREAEVSRLALLACVRRKPRWVAVWFLSSHGTQGLCLMMAASAALASEKVSGWQGSQMSGEWLQSPLVWASGFTLLVVASWFELPRAGQRAYRWAVALETRADGMLASLPGRGLALYQIALWTTSDEVQESRLRRKIGYLREQISQPPVSASRTATRAPDAGVGEATLIDPVRPPGVEPAGLHPSGADTRSDLLPEDSAEDFETVGYDGRYALQGELARGGSGIVFRARDRVLGRELALKKLPRGSRDKELAERFRQEARALASLSHPNIVHIYDLFEEGEALWIAMELVTGGDLAQAIDRRAPLPLAEAVDLVVPVAYALAAAHSADIAHRDVKPLNILISSDGSPKLTDFGLAKLMASSVETVAGCVMGSPSYMSPEQAAGQPAGAASDMYSLGVTFYELVTGRAPFEGDSAAVMAQHITQAPPAPSRWQANLPAGVDSLILEMLEKDPAARPCDMSAFAARAVASLPG